MSAASVLTQIGLTLSATAFTVATLALVTGIGRRRVSTAGPQGGAL